MNELNNHSQETDIVESILLVQWHIGLE